MMDLDTLNKILEALALIMAAGLVLRVGHHIEKKSFSTASADVVIRDILLATCMAPYLMVRRALVFCGIRRKKWVEGRVESAYLLAYFVVSCEEAWGCYEEAVDAAHRLTAISHEEIDRIVTYYTPINDSLVVARMMMCVEQTDPLTRFKRLVLR